MARANPMGDSPTPCRTSLSPVLESCVRQLLNEAGQWAEALGAGRAVGQIFAYLYLSPAARTLADMQRALGISKGSASTNVRLLAQWGAVRKVWVKGDRRDYYEASDWLGQILRQGFVDLLAKRMAALSLLLEEAETELAKSRREDGEVAFVRERVARLRNFQARVQALWHSPLARLLFSPTRTPAVREPLASSAGKRVGSNERLDSI